MDSVSAFAGSRKKLGTLDNQAARQAARRVPGQSWARPMAPEQATGRTHQTGRRRTSTPWGESPLETLDGITCHKAFLAMIIFHPGIVMAATVFSGINPAAFCHDRISETDQLPDELVSEKKSPKVDATTPPSPGLSA